MILANATDATELAENAVEEVSIFVQFLQKNLFSIIIPIALIIFLTIIALKINKKIFKVLRNRLIKNGQINVSYISFLRHTVSALIYFIAIISTIANIDPLSKIATTLLASSGFIAVAVSFASKEALSNIVSGIMILVFKPFIVGDTIKFVDKNIVGAVEDISLRHTVIRTLENKRLIVPNGTMNQTMVENANFVETKVCTFLEIGISYESSIEKARQIIVENCIKHKDFFDNRTDLEIQEGIPEIIVRVIDLDDSSVKLKAWIWAKDAGTAFAMKCDLLESIKKDFDNNAVNIPYPHITITNK